MLLKYTKKESATVRSFIEKRSGNNNVQIDKYAYNLLMYLLLMNRVLLAECAFQMSQYAKKNSVDDRGILFSLKTVYSGELLKKFLKKADDTFDIIRELSKRDVETVSDNESTSKKNDSKSKLLGTKKKSSDDSESDNASVNSSSDSSSDSE